MENKKDYANEIFNYFTVFSDGGALVNQNIKWAEFKKWGDARVGADGFLKITTGTKRVKEEGKPTGSSYLNEYKKEEKTNTEEAYPKLEEVPY